MLNIKPLLFFSYIRSHTPTPTLYERDEHKQQSRGRLRRISQPCLSESCLFVQWNVTPLKICSFICSNLTAGQKCIRVYCSYARVRAHNAFSYSNQSPYLSRKWMVMKNRNYKSHTSWLFRWEGGKKTLWKTKGQSSTARRPSGASSPAPPPQSFQTRHVIAHKPNQLSLGCWRETRKWESWSSLW